jgi:hypothetical protein
MERRIVVKDISLANAIYELMRKDGLRGQVSEYLETRQHLGTIAFTPKPWLCCGSAGHHAVSLT